MQNIELFTYGSFTLFDPISDQTTQAVGLYVGTYKYQDIEGDYGLESTLSELKNPNARTNFAASVIAVESGGYVVGEINFYTPIATRSSDALYNYAVQLRKTFELRKGVLNSLLLYLTEEQKTETYSRLIAEQYKQLHYSKAAMLPESLESFGKLLATTMYNTQHSIAHIFQEKNAPKATDCLLVCKQYNNGTVENKHRLPAIVCSICVPFYIEECQDMLDINPATNSLRSLRLIENKTYKTVIKELRNCFLPHINHIDRKFEVKGAYVAVKGRDKLYVVDDSKPIQDTLNGKQTNGLTFIYELRLDFNCSKHSLPKALMQDVNDYLRDFISYGRQY